MDVLFFAVLCALAGAAGWIGFELRAIRKVHQARWDYERICQILYMWDDESLKYEKLVRATRKTYLSKPYEVSCTNQRQ